MKVKIIAMTRYLGGGDDATARGDQMQGTDAEKLAEHAGRMCYASFGKGRPSEEFHENIRKSAHGNVLTHASFSFEISGISRDLSLELNRHSVGGTRSQRSSRYVDESGFSLPEHPLLSLYYDDDSVPKTEKEDVAAFILAAKVQADRAYELTFGALSAYAKRIGVHGHEKQARAAAARILPGGRETAGVWTFNVLALRWIIAQRTSKFADAEIAELGVRIAEAVGPHVPAYLLDDRVDEEHHLGTSISFSDGRM